MNPPSRNYLKWLEPAVAFTGLVLLSPLLAAAALSILITGGPPVLFRQERIGTRGRSFLLLKFRSMRPAAGSSITAAGDERVTAVGAVLRKYKVDELPQLWNVVRGHMSLIGPRPEVPRFVNLESEVWREVLQNKPGITDVATLLFRDEEELLAGVEDVEKYYVATLLPAKLDLNLRYARLRNFKTDIKLLLLTVWFLVMPRFYDAGRIAPLLAEKGK